MIKTSMMVIPDSIKQWNLYKNKGSKEEEWVKRVVSEAFVEVNNNPQKYAKPFEIMIPCKEKSKSTIEEWKYFAENVGGHIADWVELALSWAQMVDNGVSWDAICKVPDTEYYHRLVIWKDGRVRRIGGSTYCHDTNTVSCICNNGYSPDDTTFAVPYIVRKGSIQ